MNDNGRATVREVYQIARDIRKDMAANHLEVMTEITRLKVIAGVWGAVGGTVFGIIVKLALG